MKKLLILVIMLISAFAVVDTVKVPFALNAWGNNGWGSCSSMSGGQSYADKFCQCVGYERADTNNPCYYEYTGTRYRLGSCDDGTQTKGSSTGSGRGVTQIKCYTKNAITQTTDINGDGIVYIKPGSKKTIFEGDHSFYSERTHFNGEYNFLQVYRDSYGSSTKYILEKKGEYAEWDLGDNKKLRLEYTGEKNAEGEWKLKVTEIIKPQMFKQNEKEVSFSKLNFWYYKSRTIDSNNKLYAKKDGSNVKIKIKSNGDYKQNPVVLRKNSEIGIRVISGSMYVTWVSGSSKYPKFKVRWAEKVGFTPKENTNNPVVILEDLLDYTLFTIDNIWTTMITGNVKDPRTL